MNTISTPPNAKPIGPDPAQAKREPTNGKALATFSAGRDYAEFLPAAVELSVRPVPYVVPVLLGVIIALIGTALIWSWFASLDAFTSAAGRVRASEAPAVVQPLEAGRITAIHVANGRRVHAGETLITLDDVSVSTSLNAALAGRASQLGEVRRRAAAYLAVMEGDRGLPQPQYDADIPANVVRRENEALETEHRNLVTALSGNAAQRQEAQAKRSRIIDVKAVKARLVDVLQEKVSMAEALLLSNSGSRAAVIAAMDAKVRAEVELADTGAQFGEVEAALQNLAEQEKQAIAAYLANQSKGIQAAERQIEQLDQEIRKQKDRLHHLSLRAPIGGTVQQLATTSVDQVVTPGQALLVIVPYGSELTVEALVPSSDIGFVRVGDDVVIKADAFPFTRYGTFVGKVSALSGEAITARDAQALQDASAIASGQANTPANGVPSVTGLYFIARIQLDQPYLRLGERTLKLEPGMTVRAEIKTETRRVIDYVLSPVTQVLAEAGRER